MPHRSFEREHEPCPHCGRNACSWHLPGRVCRYAYEDQPGQVKGQPGKTEAEKLREQLEATRRDAEHQRNERQRLERQLTAAKGEQTKLKKRISAGVCPCCHRTVRQLAAHMKTKHPDFVQATNGEVVHA